MSRYQLSLRLAFGFAAGIALVAAGVWLLPSPTRCTGSLCDYVSNAALVVRQHPLSLKQVLVVSCGLGVAFSVVILAATVAFGSHRSQRHTRGGNGNPAAMQQR